MLATCLFDDDNDADVHVRAPATCCAKRRRQCSLAAPSFAAASPLRQYRHGRVGSPSTGEMRTHTRETRCAYALSVPARLACGLETIRRRTHRRAWADTYKEEGQRRVHTGRKSEWEGLGGCT
eukprot:3781188-Rhodomonas_salina.2